MLPWDKQKKAYDTESFSLNLTEGIITKSDIKELLQRIKSIPYPLKKSKFAKFDAIIILAILLFIVGLTLGVYFSAGQEFKGMRAAMVLVPAIILFLLFIALTVSCILRIKVNKNRLPILKETLEKAQKDIFNKKGAVLSLSPFESYILIELCWKYARMVSIFKQSDHKLTGSPSLTQVENQEEADQGDEFTLALRELAKRDPSKSLHGQESSKDPPKENDPQSTMRKLLCIDKLESISDEGMMSPQNRTTNMTTPFHNGQRLDSFSLRVASEREPLDIEKLKIIHENAVCNPDIDGLAISTNRSVGLTKMMKPKQANN